MKTEINGRIVKLPDFLIVGAGKSGTTSLYNYLKQHPQIFMPEIKEPKFFAFAETPTAFTHPKGSTIIWNFDEYISLFEPARDDQMLGEASPIYLRYYETTIRNIKKYITTWKSARIIMILRNPVDRAFSTYSMYRLANIEPLEFEEAILPEIVKERIENNWARGFDYLGISYYKSIKAYMDNFQHIKIYLYEDLKSDPLWLIKDIFKFLGIDDSFTPDISKKYMVSSIPRSQLLRRILQSQYLMHFFFFIPTKKRDEIRKKILHKNLKQLKMKRETRRYLVDFYKEDIVGLQKLIERDLLHWLE